MNGRTPAGVGRNGHPGVGSAWWLWLIPAAGVIALLLPGVRRDVRTAQRRQAWQHSPTTPWILDPPRGVRRTPPADLVMLIDESGSTSSSDPGGARWVQAAELVNWMTRYDTTDRITIGRFAGNAAPLRIPVPANPAILTGPMPTQRDGTNFVPAVNQANQALTLTGPRRQQVIVLITDGSGTDITQALHRINPKTRTYVFGLNDDDTWSDVRPQWGHHIHSLPITSNTKSIAEAQAALLSDLTGQQITTHQRPYPKSGTHRP